MIPPRAGHLLQYQISLTAVSNPQKLTALRSATHSTCDSGPMLGPSHSLGSVFHCVQISGQSLEAIAFGATNPFGGFHTLHACGMQIHWRLGRLHTPIVESSTTDCPQCSLLCFQPLGEGITQPTPFSSHSTQSWTILSPSPPIHTAACFLFASSSTTCDFLLWLPPVDQLRNQFCRGAVPNARPQCSTCSCRFGHSFW